MNRVERLVRTRWELLALVALAASLDLWALGQNGWANEYYSAAVRSMSSSWHNFLFGSFDPSGVMTVDKPPLALWVQSLSVRAFGFHPLAMLVPQALMGVASVVLLYDLVRRRFGRIGGFAAGLALAITPITVAISRHNNPDALLVLCAVAALWCVVRALEDGRTRWLVWCGVAVGLGFETKMAVALMIVPAITAAWLWAAPRGVGRALRQLLAGGAAMIAVGGAWPLLVALTPAADRPWISGTSDNSIWSLITGYNGLGRIAGETGGPQSFGGGGPFGGSSSPLRLFNQALGGQAGWLLGVAAVGLVGIALSSRLRRRDLRSAWLIAVGGSFVTVALAFSFARGIFHPYYVSFLAPLAAALVGATVAEAVRDGGGRLARYLGPAAIAGGVLSELGVLHGATGQLTWLAPVLIAGGGAMALALALRPDAQRRRTVLASGVGLLLLAPAIWAFDTLGYAASGTFPAGGPQSAASMFGPGGGPPGGIPGALLPGGPPVLGALPPAPGGFGSGLPGAMPPPPMGALPTLPGAPAAGGFGGPGGGQALGGVLRYTANHGGGTIAVASQSGAASSIIDSGAPVAGIGGFSGRESSVSVPGSPRRSAGARSAG